MLGGLLGLYWNARKQPLDECVDLCARTLAAMRKQGFHLSAPTGRSPKQVAGKAAGMSNESIRKLLLGGVNRTDVDRRVIPELGYTLMLGSGHLGPPGLGLTVCCGSYSEWVGNNLVLNLPATGPGSLEEDQAKAEALFDVLVGVWRPNAAVLCHADELEWEDDRIAPGIKAFKRYPPVAELDPAPDRDGGKASRSSRSPRRRGG